jgi:BirA family transcriptional regulator, biotin operon repressor / biotin---[acetyl-CoA-carboxylase] ligase
VTPVELDRALDAAASRLGPFTRVEFLPETGSTNDIALHRAHDGAPHGTVVVADMQTAGRGRRGRAWHSPPEAGVYLSAVLRAEAWAGALSLLTLAAGVAVARAIGSATGLAVELKWPNDVVIGRPWRKLAGILSETAAATPRVDAVVVGIGVNVRGGSFPPEIAHRATALEIELGRPVDRVAFIIELLAAPGGGWAAPDLVARLFAGMMVAPCAAALRAIWPPMAHCLWTPAAAALSVWSRAK